MNRIFLQRLIYSLWMKHQRGESTRLPSCWEGESSIFLVSQFEDSLSHLIAHLLLLHHRSRSHPEIQAKCFQASILLYWEQEAHSTYLPLLSTFHSSSNNRDSILPLSWSILKFRSEKYRPSLASMAEVSYFGLSNQKKETIRLICRLELCFLQGCRVYD